MCANDWFFLFIYFRCCRSRWDFFFFFFFPSMSLWTCTRMHGLLRFLHAPGNPSPTPSHSFPLLPKYSWRTRAHTHTHTHTQSPCESILWFNQVSNILICEMFIPSSQLMDLLNDVVICMPIFTLFKCGVCILCAWVLCCVWARRKWKFEQWYNKEVLTCYIGGNT